MHRGSCSIAKSFAFLALFIGLDGVLSQDIQRTTPIMPSAQTGDCGPHCERFGDDKANKIVVFLHGSSGTEGYRQMAQKVADAGYFVLFPHYLEVRGSHNGSYADYAAWTTFVEGITDRAATADPHRPIFAFGVSLGASVALAAATEDVHIAAVVDWAGSLPDAYFRKLRRFPPTLILHGKSDDNIPVINAEQLIRLCTIVQQSCTSHLYPGEGHVFPHEHPDAWHRTFVFIKEFPN